jgi:hypothetical protein
MDPRESPADWALACATPMQAAMHTTASHFAVIIVFVILDRRRDVRNGRYRNTKRG